MSAGRVLLALGIFYVSAIFGVIASVVLTLLVGFAFLPKGEGTPGDGIPLVLLWFVLLPVCVGGMLFAAALVWRKYIRPLSF